MISIGEYKDAAALVHYHREHLLHPERFPRPPRVLGGTAVRLGLSETISYEQFEALAHNRHPTSGERITARHNTTRWEPDADAHRPWTEVGNRRPAYDFTASAPKDVSLLTYLTEDEFVLEEMQAGAVERLVEEMEAWAATRVRRNKADTVARTGNLIAVEFQHAVSRAVDPQVHSHAVIFNMSWVAAEERYQALDFETLLSPLAYLRQVYLAELKSSLAHFGYEIEPTEHAFTIRGVPAELRDEFSKRHQHIERMISEAEAEAEEGRPLSRRAVRLIGSGSRPRKALSVPLPQLRAKWQAELREISGLHPNVSRQALAQLFERSLARIGKHPARTAEAKVAAARQRLAGMAEELFARHSARPGHAIWSSVLKRSAGEFTARDLRQAWEKACARREFLKLHSGVFSTVQAIESDYDLDWLIHAGRQRFAPFARPEEGSKLLPQVARVLENRDLVCLVRPGRPSAGGEVSVAQQIAGVAGKKLQVACWQARAVSTSAEDDVVTAARGMQLLVVENAELIKRRELTALLRAAQQSGVRVILVGAHYDRHSLLSTLERKSEIVIYDARAEAVPLVAADERDAAEELAALQAEGKAGQALLVYHEEALLHDLPADALLGAIAQEYVAAVRNGRSVLALAGSAWAAAEINRAVREQLVDAGVLGPPLPACWLRSLLEVDENIDHDFQEGDRLYAVRGVGAIHRGEWVEVVAPSWRDERQVEVRRANGEGVSLSREQALRCDAYRPRDVQMRVGDKLQLACTVPVGDSKNAKKIRAGEMVTVEGVTADAFLLDRRREVLFASAVFEWGYCLPPHRPPKGLRPEELLVRLEWEEDFARWLELLLALWHRKQRRQIFTAERARLQRGLEAAARREGRSARDQMLVYRRLLSRDQLERESASIEPRPISPPLPARERAATGTMRPSGATSAPGSARGKAVVSLPPPPMSPERSSAPPDAPVGHADAPAPSAVGETENTLRESPASDDEAGESLRGAAEGESEKPAKAPRKPKKEDKDNPDE